MKRMFSKILLVVAFLTVSVTPVLADTNLYEECEGEKTVETYAGNLKIKSSYLRNITTGISYHTWSGTFTKKSSYPGASYTNRGATNPYGKTIRASYRIDDGFGNTLFDWVDIGPTNCYQYSFPGEPMRMDIGL